MPKIITDSCAPKGRGDVKITVDISLNCNEKFTINQQIRFSK